MSGSLRPKVIWQGVLDQTWEVRVVRLPFNIGNSIEVSEGRDSMEETTWRHYALQVPSERREAFWASLARALAKRLARRRRKPKKGTP